MRRSRIGIVIRYSNQLDEVMIDYDKYLDLSYIKNRPICEWFEKSNGRVEWNGLIEEIRKKIHSKTITLVFDFKGPEEKKNEFERQLEIHDIEPCNADGLTPAEIVERNISLAKDEEVNNNYSAAFRHFLIAADEGDSDECQYFVADVYRKICEGEKTKYTIEKKVTLNDAYIFYLRAAEHKNSKAYSYLADCYYYGKGVKKNNSEAFRYYSLANENDDHRTDHELAECYYNGLGCTVDKDKAYKLYLKTQDYYRLMECCFYGYGRNISYMDAFEYFKKLPAGGNAEIENELGMMFDEYYSENARFIKSNKSDSFILYKRAADQGYAAAQNNIGRYYEKGIEVQSDLRKAFEFYKLSADQGNIEAEYNVGRCFDEGIGTEKNPSVALSYYERAAEFGLLSAMYKVAWHYEKAISEEYKKTRAFQLYKKSALKGYPPSESGLGRCYYYGIGTKIDFKEAFKWLKKGYDDGCKEAMKELGECYCYGKGTLLNVKNAVELFKKCKYESKDFKRNAELAEQGDSQAEASLGKYYYYGEEISKDYIKAFHWLKKAYDDGCSEAIKELAECYYYGRGTSINYEKAFELFVKCNCHLRIMECYYYGRGIEKDISKVYEQVKYVSGIDKENNSHFDDEVDDKILNSLGLYLQKLEINENRIINRLKRMQRPPLSLSEYFARIELKKYKEEFTLPELKSVHFFKKAAENGYNKAQYQLARCYEDGLGITKDKETAFSWYEKAAENGYKGAQNKLGNCYAKGKCGVEKNEELAFKWHRKAADQGIEQSKKFCTVDGLQCKTYSEFKKAKEKK